MTIRFRILPFPQLRRSWARWTNTRRGGLFTCCGVMIYRRPTP